MRRADVAPSLQRRSGDLTPPRVVPYLQRDSTCRGVSLGCAGRCRQMNASPVPPIATPRSRVQVTLVTVALLLSTLASVTAVNTPTAEAADSELYIVVQTGPPLALYQGGVAGLAPTNPESRGELKLDVGSAASTAYLRHLANVRSALLTSLSAALGRKIEANREYNVALNGFTTRL